MKNFIRIACSILLLCSSLITVGSLAAQDIAKNELPDVAIQQLGIGDKLIGSLSGVQSLLSEENQAKFTDITNSIRTSDELHSILEAYSTSFFIDVASKEEPKPNNDELNARAVKYIVSFSDPLKDLLPAQLSDAQKQLLIDEMAKTINLDNYYIAGVNTMRDSLSSTQLTMLSLFATLAKSSTFILSLLIMIASITVLLVLDIKDRTFGKSIPVALFLSGCILLVMRVILPFVFSAVLIKLPVANVDFHPAAYQTILFFALGYIVCSIITFIISVRIANPE